MYTKIVNLLLFSFVLSTSILAQNPVTLRNSKKPIRIYCGGRPRYSKVILYLYSDSTFLYSEWYHFNKLQYDSGIYKLTDSTLIIYSQSFLAKKNAINILFKGDTYKIHNNQLFLFPKNATKKDIDDFYRQYFILLRTR
jgi:hypothetical protein